MEIKTRLKLDREEQLTFLFKKSGTVGVIHIVPHDNCGAGSSILKVLSDLSEGTKIKVEVVDGKF